MVCLAVIAIPAFIVAPPTPIRRALSVMCSRGVTT